MIKNVTKVFEGDGNHVKSFLIKTNIYQTNRIAMHLKEFEPREALHKAFLKIKPNRLRIEAFKSNLMRLLDTINDTESELRTARACLSL